MKQHNMYPYALISCLALVAILSSTGCEAPACRELRGRWSTKEGQCIIFQQKGNALWLTRFGSQMDTVRMQFRYDCTKQPVELDLHGFQSGPLTDKTLYGILEWTSDTAFRMNAEAGTDATLRPKAFESDQTMQFVLDREKSGGQ
jgi:hypothetical protein